MCARGWCWHRYKLLLSGEDRDNSRRLPKGHSFSFSLQEHKLHLLYWNGCFTKLDPVARPLTMPTCSLCRARLHTIFGRSDSEQTQSIICAVEEPNFWCYPTKPNVSHASCIVCGIPTFMSWSVLGCRVTTCCVVSHPGCFLETECHAPPRHVMPYQTTSRSLFAKRRHKP